MSGTELARIAPADQPEAPAERALGLVAGVPCLISNNSNEPLNSGHRRAEFALRENVRLLAQEYGFERLGFLTLTFADHVTEIKEAQRRFNSLRTGVLSKRYAGFIAVVERMKSGRIHWHVLVVCPEDIRSGFNFAKVSQGDYGSANPWLRKEWAFWRKTAKAYRFGRTELLPVKTNAEGLARYLAKYIAKHIGNRLPADKGAHLVRYSVSARHVSTRFQFVSDRSFLFRAKLAKFASRFHVKEGGMQVAFGKNWSSILRDIICAVVPDVYQNTRQARIDGLDPSPLGEDATWIRHKNCLDPLWEDPPYRWLIREFAISLGLQNRLVIAREITLGIRVSLGDLYFPEFEPMYPETDGGQSNSD